MTKLNKIFNKKNRIIIGAIHLPPLFGYKQFVSMDDATKNALKDLAALEVGGADGVIFENNYDIPHKEFVDSKTADQMHMIGKALRKSSDIPIGASVLWNDYKSALILAKSLDLKFIRIPVFVDLVETKYGIIKGNPRAVKEFQKEINAENVALFTDIHVKHAKIISKYSLQESAELAISSGSNGLIVTGKWTGESPELQDLKMIRKQVGGIPIIIGSGLNRNNASNLMSLADAAIVNTSLRIGDDRNCDPTINNYSRRIDRDKVTELVSVINKPAKTS